MVKVEIQDVMITISMSIEEYIEFSWSHRPMMDEITRLHTVASLGKATWAGDRN